MAQPTQWLEWTRRLAALAQSGLTYSQSPYDTERYQEVASIAAEMLAERFEGGVPAPEIAARFAADTGYATPKVDVRAAVIHEGKILLVLEKEDGRWTLPGGWADVGDVPSQAAERETLEESGYIVKARRLVLLHDHRLHNHPAIPHHAWKLFFLCELMGGEARESEETGGVGWFAEDEIPALSETRTVPAQIHELFAFQRDPARWTEFD